MTRFFNSPFLLGFDHLEQLLERTARMAGDGYPPYNIEATENGLAITLAVAGFSADELAITVEERQLIVRGRQGEAGDGGRTFLHRGIAARQFQRAFVLAEGIDVTSATLENGLLRIDLVRPEVRPGVRVIEISNGGQT